MTEPLTDRERFNILHRGEAPSRVPATQIRADYKALLDEIGRLRMERGKERYVLARLAIGETDMPAVVEELGLGKEIAEVERINAENAAFSAALRAPMFGDEPDCGEDEDPGAPAGIEALLAAVAEQLPQDDPEKCAETLAGMNGRLADGDA